ncbi:MAG TPA: dihydrodipicolinate reductase C-terminal domain-containing protein [Xanthomonadaceae bacterium]|nr:dihydrodipicolinate reductase C-terminal domain-containing protein [Xanthomonadaceae bacterium]
MAAIRLMLHGASGRMGGELLALLDRDPRFALVAVAARDAMAVPEGSTFVAAERLEQAPAVDLVIDFSLAGAVAALAGFCAERGAGLVSGTTGLDDAGRAALDAAALRVPVVWESNYSIGVAVLGELLTRAAAMLRDWQCDILEQHHRHKRDAPSGTALSLGELASAQGMAPRYHSVRAGEIVGEHAVQLTGAAERLELVHRAHSRSIFAHGALEAAARVHGRAPGRYRLRQLLSG